MLLLLLLLLLLLILKSRAGPECCIIGPPHFLAGWCKEGKTMLMKIRFSFVCVSNFLNCCCTFLYCNLVAVRYGLLVPFKVIGWEDQVSASVK